MCIKVIASQTWDIFFETQCRCNSILVLGHAIRWKYMTAVITQHVLQDSRLIRSAVITTFDNELTIMPPTNVTDFEAAATKSIHLSNDCMNRV